VEEHHAYCQVLLKRAEDLRPLLQRISLRELVVEERLELERLKQNPERLQSRLPSASMDRKKEEAMTARVKNLEKLTSEV
jgi:hypothetical protein